MASSNISEMLNSSCPQVEGCHASTIFHLGSDPFVSEATHLLIQFIGSGLLTGLISVFGVLANIVNCLVFSRQGLRDRMNLCLFALALVDLLLLLCFVLVSSLHILKDRQPTEAGLEIYSKTYLYLLGVVYALRTTSGWYIMVIAVERCLCIVFPLQAPSLMTSQTVGAILVFLAVISQLGFICQPFKYDLIKTEAGGISRWLMTPSQLWQNNRETIDTFVYTIFGVSVPLMTFVIVSLATFITVLRLTAAMSWRRQTSSAGLEQNGQQLALTKTLVVASGLYIVCMVPIVLIKTARLFEEEFSVYGLYVNVYRVCNSVADVFTVINSSVHIFVYYSRSARYRKYLNELCHVGSRPKLVTGVFVTENTSVNFK